MDPTTRSSFTVRSYEVDSYAHLNNGVYLSWFEQSRLDWLVARGFSYDGFAERKEWFVVARIEVDFRAPLVTGERVEVDAQVQHLGHSSVRWHQVMRRVPAGGEAGAEGAVVCEAETIMVFSGEGGGSIPIPADFRAAAEGG